LQTLKTCASKADDPDWRGRGALFNREMCTKCGLLIAVSGMRFLAAFWQHA